MGCCVLALGAGFPAAVSAAGPEDVSASEASLLTQAAWSVQVDEAGTVSVQLFPAGLTLRRFQDADPGTTRIVDTIVDPARRHNIYFSVRVDHGKTGEGPFTTKVFRYDLETRRLARIYRQAGGSGYTFLGFIGDRLLVADAPYGDNSPGPCWQDELLAKKKLAYLDVRTPWLGMKTFAPSAAFQSRRAKALAACEAGMP